jgi:hypothetical protein
MDDLAEFFKQSLKEEGLDAEVKHMVSHERQADVFKITKEINGEESSVETGFTFRQQAQDPAIKQTIAYEAARIARNYDEYLTSRVDWGDKCVHFDFKDGYSATCVRCGTKVDLDSLSNGSPRMAETAVPNPPSRGLDGLPEVKIEMTLQALLRNECNGMCPNSAQEWP